MFDGLPPIRPLNNRPHTDRDPDERPAMRLFLAIGFAALIVLIVAAPGMVIAFPEPGQQITFLYP